MRISAEAKRATRSRILEAARALFAQGGFEAATTRDLAAAASIATGTLFNYFTTKDEIVLAFATEALERAHEEFESRSRPGESLDEDLFDLIATELRWLKPHRTYLRPVLETALSPLARSESRPDGEAIRVEHLELAGQQIARRFDGQPLSPVTLTLYWTLYTGVLAYWATDSSPNQEDTLAVLDHYLRAFVGSLAQSE